MGKVRKKKAVGTDVFTLACERTEYAFKAFDHVAVSFSGGKDSTAVLNVAIEVARSLGKLPVHVLHFDEEAIQYQTADYVRRVSRLPEVALDWYCLPVRHRNACSRRSPWWFPWAPEDEALWVRPLPPEGITQDGLPAYPREPEKRMSVPDTVGLLFDPMRFGRVAMLQGIRADESLTRTRAILLTGQEPRPYVRQWHRGAQYGGRRNLFNVYPIYDWRTADVWHAPRRFGWDYNQAYDVMEAAGLTHDAQRVAPPFGEEPMGKLWTYKTCFPELWDRMCNRVPGAATAARYSTTALYSHGQTPEKPEGLSWQDWLRFWLDKHPPEYRAEIASRIQAHIRRHNRRTKDPFAAKAPHPLTGYSWAFLVNIAVRGDYKGRRQSSVFPSDYEKNKARYDAEIASMRARGELV